MKRIRFLIPAVLLIIAISLWAIQYNNINRYFNNTYPLALKCYEAGDVVPFEDNVLAGNELNGYKIKVNRTQIMETSRFLETHNISNHKFENLPEKVCDVELTIYNENSDAEGIYLPDLVLHGVDYQTDWNSDLMNILNSEMGGALGVSVPNGYEYTVHIVYNLRKMHFATNTWENIDNYSLFIKVADYPSRIDIKLTDIEYL